MMKRILILLILTSLSWWASAQSLSVGSFNELPNDLDAKTHFPKIFTQTNTKCAIIKIVNTNQGFTFDVGSLPVVTTEVHADLGETWVYVPEGVKKIKIAHPQLGQLTTPDGYYWFPISVKAATCYRLMLISGKTSIVIEEAKRQTGWLIIKSNPSDADVYITMNGEESLMGNTSSFQQKMEYGDYRYRLTKPLYHDEVGMVKVDQARVEISPSLAPAYGRISVTSNPSGAKVEIDGLRDTYTTPCTTEVLASGTYTLRFSKENYSRVQKQVVVQDNQITPVDATLNASFATVTISSLPQAEIYLNGVWVAMGTYKEDLPFGVYEIEARLTSHKTASRQIEVSTNKPQTISLNPTPIYGSLDVVTNPMDASVILDGKNVGKTPITLDQVLIGEHKVEIIKPGCAPVERRITIEEKKHETVEVELVQGLSISLTSSPANASVYVDETLIGATPILYAFPFGKHTVRVATDARYIEREFVIKPDTVWDVCNFNLFSSESKKIWKPTTFIVANFAYGNSVPSVGVSFGKVKHLGWFVSALTGFDFNGYEASESFASTDDVLPFLTGEKSYQRLSVLAGPVLKVSNNFAFKFGLGYGKNNMFVQTLGDKWYKVSDASVEGIETSFGAQFNMGRLTFSIEGVSTNFSIFEAKMGVGINF